jgi:hypothetical protein
LVASFKIYQNLYTTKTQYYKNHLHTSWGRDTSSLLKIYRALIRSKAEYGSTIFRTSNQKYLNIFDTPLNTAIHFSLGYFKSSPIESLRNLANELPLDLRITYNTFLYTTRLFINNKKPFQQIPSKNIKEAEEYHINLQHLVKRKSQNIPPWKM